MTSALRSELFSACQFISAWTYGTSLFPSNIPNINKKPKQVYRIAEPQDVFVERNEVTGAANTLIKNVQIGEIKKLIAGTGTGKSTILPVDLAIAQQGVGIVVTPTRHLARTLAKFVKKNIAIGRRSRCVIASALELIEFRGLQAPAVSYIGASDFLLLMAQNSDLFKTLNVAYVYIDEAHEPIPQYQVIKYLISGKFFADTKVFMGSATSTDQNLERRQGGVPHRVIKVDPVMLMYDDPDGLSDKSPLHHSKINDRTLVFLPSVVQFQVMREYYEKKALPVVELPEYASPEEYANVYAQLKDKRPIVVLVTPTHQTGYTFDADTVVDCGITNVLDINMDKGTISINCRMASEAEKIQRCGRVGRHIAGKAYCVNVESEDELPVVNPGAECYVALWCRLLNIEVNDDGMRVWDSFVKPMSAYKICLLLGATIHPLILSGFIDDAGDVAPGTRLIFLNFLRMQRKLVATSPLYGVDLVTSMWQEQVLSLPCIPVNMQEYKTEFTVPREWAVWANVMYHAMHGYDARKAFSSSKSGEINDAVSVASGSTAVSAAFSFGETASSVKSERSQTKSKRSKASTVVDMKNKYSPNHVRSPLADGQVNATNTPPPVYKGLETVASTKFEAVETWRETVPKQMLNVIEDVFVQQPVVTKVGRCGEPGCIQPDCGYVKPALRSGGTNVRDVTYSDDRQTANRKSVEAVPMKRYASSPNKPVTGGGDRVEARQDSVSPRRNTAKRRSRQRLSLRDLDKELIEPYDFQLAEGFVRLHEDDRQRMMYKQVKDNAVDVGSMSVQRREEYFMAVLVSWNRAVSGYYQLRAKPKSNVFSKTITDYEMSKVIITLDRVKLLLEMFEVHGMCISSMRSKNQSGGVLDLREFSREIASADYAYKWASDAFRTTCDKKDRLATSLYDVQGRVGSACKLGTVLISAEHVGVPDGVKPREFAGIPYTILLQDKRTDLLKVKYGSSTANPHHNVTVRRAVDGESVSVMLPLTAHVIMVGFFTVVSIGSVCVYDGNLPDGASGSPLISISDGAIVGIHLGAYPCVDGQVMSKFQQIC